MTSVSADQGGGGEGGEKWGGVNETFYNNNGNYDIKKTKATTRKDYW